MRSAGQLLQRILKTARIADLHKAEKGILAHEIGNTGMHHQGTPSLPVRLFSDKNYTALIR